MIHGPPGPLAKEQHHLPHECLGIQQQNLHVHLQLTAVVSFSSSSSVCRKTPAALAHVLRALDISSSGTIQNKQLHC